MAKVGLGLWNYPYVTLAVEAALLFGTLGIYLTSSRPVTGRARYSMLVFAVAIFLLQAGMLFSGPPPSDRAMATTALIAYVVFAAAIAWLERGRTIAERGRGGMQRFDESA